jgi:hypothetical protein
MIVANDKRIIECPTCHGPVCISYMELKETKQIIRKATCPDGRCATRTWQRIKLAKRAERKYQLYCLDCQKEVELLVVGSKGLVCKDCLKKQREVMRNESSFETATS